VNKKPISHNFFSFMKNLINMKIWSFNCDLIIKESSTPSSRFETKNEEDNIEGKKRNSKFLPQKGR